MAILIHLVIRREELLIHLIIIMTWQSDRQYTTMHLTITVGTVGGSGAGGGGAVAPGAGQALAWLDAIEVGADTRVPVIVYPYRIE